MYDCGLLQTNYTYAFVCFSRPRSYLTPVRDEEAESQRKAKSRHARQTRRLTQVLKWFTCLDFERFNKLFTHVKLCEYPAGYDSD